MKKIFIDVGGHFGETLDDVLRPVWQFDVVHCFEPQAKCFAFLQSKFAKQITAGKLILHNCGLADFNGERNLFGGASSTIGATLFADKNDVDSEEIEKCEFVRASDFVKSAVSHSDFAVMKLNCEGGEALILRDLMQSGTIHSLNSIFIDFDIRKIPSQSAEEPKIMAEMKALKFCNYALAHETTRVKTWSFSKRRRVERSFGGYGLSKIRIWLAQIEGAEHILNFTLASRIIRHLPISIWGRAYRIRKIFRKRCCRNGI